MSTQLGKAKVFFTKGDFGKMLKLKDINNLYIGNIINNQYGDGSIEVEIITPMDNVTNNRAKSIINQDIRLSFNSDIPSGKNYYLSFDVSREGINHGVIFEEINDSELKIIKFIKIAENRLDEVADKLIESINGIDNCKIIIPTVNIGQAVVNYLQEKGFTDIIELDLDDMRNVAINNKDLIQNKDKLFKLIPDNYSNEDLIEFIKMSKELDNTDIDVNCSGQLRFKRKSMEVTSTRICAVFYALSKLENKNDNVKYNYTISNDTIIKPFCSTTINCIKFLYGKFTGLKIEYELDSVGQKLLDNKIIQIKLKSESIEIKNMDYIKETSFKITIKDSKNGSVILNNEEIKLISI